MAKDSDQFGQRKLKHARPGLFWHLLHGSEQAGMPADEEAEDGAAG